MMARRFLIGSVTPGTGDSGTKESHFARSVRRTFAAHSLFCKKMFSKHSANGEQDGPRTCLCSSTKTQHAKRLFSLQVLLTAGVMSCCVKMCIC